MMIYRNGHNGYWPMIFSPEAFANLSEEVETVLDSWTDDGYRDIIDTTEYLDSSRVKRID